MNIDGRESERSKAIGSPGISRRGVLIGAVAAALTGAVTWRITSSVAGREPSDPSLAAVTGTPVSIPKIAARRPLGLTVYEYEPVRIANLAELILDEPVAFSYPGAGQTALLVKLGLRADGGAGTERDVVAFSDICTHMGCPLGASYNGQHKMLGPCPCHFTTFDLTRRGLVVIGQATEDLPQIQLNVDDSTGDIFATGVVGLAYGYHSNLDALVSAAAAR